MHMGLSIKFRHLKSFLIKLDIKFVPTKITYSKCMKCIRELTNQLRDLQCGQYHFHTEVLGLFSIKLIKLAFFQRIK